MRKVILYLFILIILCTYVSAYADDPQVLSWYECENNTNDQTGNNDGTVTTTLTYDNTIVKLGDGSCGSGPWSSTNGFYIPEGAFYQDGINDSGCINFWFRYHANQGAILSQEDASRNEQLGHYIRDDVQAPLQEYLLYYNYVGAWSLNDASKYGGDIWYMQTITWNTTGTYIYRNGSLKRNTTNTMTINADGPIEGRLYFGTQQGSNALDGWLDSIAFFNDTCSPENITKLYNSHDGCDYNCFGSEISTIYVVNGSLNFTSDGGQSCGFNGSEYVMCGPTTDTDPTFTCETNGASTCKLWNESLNYTTLDNNGIPDCATTGTPSHICTFPENLTIGNHTLYISCQTGEYEMNDFIDANLFNISIYDLSPVISNVHNETVTSQTAEINWTTNEVSNTSVNYGTTINLGTIVGTDDSVTSHGYLLTELERTTLYFYNVTSCDSTSNCATDGHYNFTTLEGEVLYLDGIAANRTYEYQTTANITTTFGGQAGCVDIGYPGYGYDYACSNESVNVNLPIDDPGVNIFTDGLFLHLYEFLYYGWLGYNITLDNLHNVTRTRVGLAGALSDASRNKFDDWDSVSKEYNASGYDGFIINLIVDGDDDYIDAEFTVSLGSNSDTTEINNISVDMFNDGVIDYNYAGTIDELNPQEVDLNITLLNNYIDTVGNESITISFNITLNETLATKATIGISGVNFYKNTVSYPTSVKVDVGNDGGIDAEFSGAIVGDEILTSTISDGNSSKAETCNDENCSLTFDVQLTSNLDYDECYFYLQGVGIGATFTEAFNSTDYIDTNTLSLDTFFEQLEMNGSSGSYTNGELVSTFIRNMTTILETVTIIADDQIDSGADIDYYISTNDSDIWEEVTEGVSTALTNTGTDIRYKVIITSNLAKTANAYINTITITDLGDYPENVTVDIGGDGVDKTYNYIFDSDLGLFKANIGCTEVNTYLDTCADTLCDVPFYINFTGPGGMRALQLHFSSELADVELDANVTIKHQVNSQLNITAVSGSVTGDVNGSSVYNYLIFPGYCVANDVYLSITGSYWR